VIQKKRESLQEFIQRFCNKRNVFPEVDDKSIIMFFKKGLRDSSLIYKHAMKNPRTLEGNRQQICLDRGGGPRYQRAEEGKRVRPHGST
jgi:hypothetical protein